MLTNIPILNIKRGNGALKPFRANYYFPTNIAGLPLFFNFSMI